MLVSMAPLLKPSPSEAKLGPLEKKRDALAHRRPQHIGCRQVLLRGLNMRSEDMRAAGRTVAPNMRERLMQQHGQMRQDVGAEACSQYGVGASAERDRATEKLQGQKLEAEAELQLLRERTHQEEASGNPMMLSSHRLGPNQLAELGAQFAGKDCPAKLVGALRAASSELIGPPVEAERQALEASVARRLRSAAISAAMAFNLMPPSRHISKMCGSVLGGRGMGILQGHLRHAKPKVGVLVEGRSGRCGQSEH